MTYRHGHTAALHKGAKRPVLALLATRWNKAIHAS